MKTAFIAASLATLIAASPGSSALAFEPQDQEPNISQSGEHFRFLAAFAPEWSIEDVYEEAGLLTAKHSETGMFILLDLNGRQAIDGSFDAVKIHNAEFVSIFNKSQGVWGLIHLASKSTWSSAYVAQFLDGGEVIQYVTKSEAYLCDPPTPGKPLTRRFGPYEAITPNSSETVLVRKGNLLGWVGLDGEIKVPFAYKSGTRLGSYIRVERAKREGEDSTQGRVGLFTLDGRMLLPCEYDRIDEPVHDVCTWLAEDGRCGATNLRTGEVVFEVSPSGSYTYDISNVDGETLRVAKTVNVGGAIYGSGSTGYGLHKVGAGELTQKSFFRIESILTPTGPVYLTLQTRPLMAGGVKLRNAAFEVIAENVAGVIPEGDLLFIEPSLSASWRKPQIITHDGRVLVDEKQYCGSAPKVESEKKGEFRLEHNGRIPVRMVVDLPEMPRSLRFAFLDMKGEVAIQQRFHNVSFFKACGLAAAEVDDGWGIIDRDGQFIMKPGVHSEVMVLGSVPLVQAWDPGASFVYDTKGVELFRAGEGIKVRVLSKDLILAVETGGDQPGRSFLFKLF